MRLSTTDAHFFARRARSESVARISSITSSRTCAGSGSHGGGRPTKLAHCLKSDGSYSGAKAASASPPSATSGRLHASRASIAATCAALSSQSYARRRSTESTTTIVGRVLVCSIASSSSSSAVADELVVRSTRIQLFESLAASSTAAKTPVSFCSISSLITSSSISATSTFSSLAARARRCATCCALDARHFSKLAPVMDLSSSSLLTSVAGCAPPASRFTTRFGAGSPHASATSLRVSLGASGLPLLTKSACPRIVGSLCRYCATWCPTSSDDDDDSGAPLSSGEPNMLNESRGVGSSRRTGLTGAASLASSSLNSSDDGVKMSSINAAPVSSGQESRAV